LGFAPPSIGPAEKAAVMEALDSGWLTAGPRCLEFERVMAAHLGAGSALALSSCTAALHLAMVVSNLGPGEAVITTPLTFASTAHAAVYVGARPLLVDVSRDTGNLDPASVERFLRLACAPGPDGRPIHQATNLTVAALVPVHYGGHPADMEALWRLSLEHRLHMIEDAAHALGSKIGSLPVGHPALVPSEAAGLGLLSLCAFSFYATKNIATGEGGLLTGSDPEALERARRLSAYGISDARRIWGRYAAQGTWAYDVAEAGYKYNFTDIQAALGLAQMSRLKSLLSGRAERAAVWRKALEDLTDLVELPVVRPGFGHSWHLFPLRIRPERLRLGRDTLIEALRALNVGTSVMFIPLHFHSFYQRLSKLEPGSLPVAEDFFYREISLPVSPASSIEAVKAAASLLRELLIRNAITGRPKATRE
jgi:dTDP-4-amino-4,6-dideoxygalactose transaminase